MLELSHIYLYVSLRHAFGSGWWNRAALSYIFAVFLYRHIFRRWIVAPEWRIAAENIYNYYLGFAVIACIVFAFGDFVRVFAWLAGRWFATPAIGWAFSKTFTLALLGLSVAAYLYALHEARAYRIVRIEIPTRLLPTGRDRLRVAAFSDLHIRYLTGEREVRRVVDMINAENPDIVVAVGDTVDVNMTSREGERGAFRALKAPHRFAVLGNHEAYRGTGQAVDFLEESGLTVLRGEAIEAEGIVIAGVDDPRVRPATGRIWAKTADATWTLFDADRERFVLLLAHRPPVTEGARGRFDLQISGHTHGGQIFLARPLMRLIYRLPQGLSTLPTGSAGNKVSRVFVMNGVGFYGPPVRLFAPPEILVVDLIRAEQSVR